MIILPKEVLRRLVKLTREDGAGGTGIFRSVLMDAKVLYLAPYTLRLVDGGEEFKIEKERKMLYFFDGSATVFSDLDVSDALRLGELSNKAMAVDRC